MKAIHCVKHTNEATICRYCSGYDDLRMKVKRYESAITEYRASGHAADAARETGIDVNEAYERRECSIEVLEALADEITYE